MSSKKAKRPGLREWTFEEVKKRLPYLRSLLETIRESSWRANAAYSRIRRLNRKPGRPDRQRYTAIEEAQQEFVARDREVLDALEEMTELGVLCNDPVQSVAMFYWKEKHDSGGFRGAWFVFCPFGNQLYWRYDEEPETTRRDVHQLSK